MKELRGTTRERGFAGDLALDDIIIEDVSEGALDTAMPGEERPDIGEDISIEELPPESIQIVDEASDSRTQSARLTGADVLIDLEALTSEIDRIDRVAPEAKQRPRFMETAGDPENSGLDTSALKLDDFDQVQELNLDDMVPATGREQPAATLEPQADAVPAELREASDDLPYDLIDDEFIILEDEHGATGAATARDKAGPVTGGDVLEDDLVRLHGEMSGEHPGSIIEENLAEKIEKEEIPVQVREPARARSRKSGEITIQIPEKVRKNLPGSFKMSDLRPIDLFEAEKIASEDILLLREEDLIEELDSLDLVPLDDEPDAGELPPFEEETAQEDWEAEAGASPLEDSTPEPVEVEVREEAVGIPSVTGEPVAVIDEVREPSAGPAGFKEPRDIIDESEIPVKREEMSGEVPSGPILLEEETPEQDISRGEPAELPVEIEELPEEKEHASEHTDDEVPEPKLPEYAGATGVSAAIPDHGVTAPRGTRHHTVEKAEAKAAYDGREPARVMIRESIPAEFAAVASGDKVYIIDDLSVEKEVARSESIFEENDLEKITTNMVEVVEGESKFLREASAEEDQDQIAAIMSGTALAFEDLLIDFEDEYKFSDEETGFIDSSFVSEAFLSHDSGAAGKAVGKLRGKKTMALEIFGLTDHEISDIESGIFTREFGNIDLSKVPGAGRPGLDQTPDDFELSRKYMYIGNSAENMTRAEKSSVEEDLSGSEAVILEENTDDIRRILANYRKKKKTVPGGVKDISDEIVIIEDSGDMERFAGTIPAEKRRNIKSLLKYLDGLFEKLPEDVIRKFAESEYYNIYVKVLNELDR